MTTLAKDKADIFIEDKHRGQVYNNLPYTYHCYQVAMVIGWLFPNDLDMYRAALLHDILEETKVTYSQLKKEFGERVADLVREVTKTGYNTFPNLKTREGVILKYADRLCNLVNMKNWSEAQQLKYIDKSRFWYE